MLTKRVELAGLLMFVLFPLVLSCGKDNPECPNVAPTASFTMSPVSGTTVTLFQFDASTCSDDEDTPASLRVRWDWENDGTWDTDWSMTKTANHQYGTAGTKAVKLEVKDSGDLVDDATQEAAVSLPNTPPTASFMVNPVSGSVYDVFTFDASISSDAQDPMSALQVRWDWENDGTWDTEWSTAKAAANMYDTEGTKTISLEVRDTGGLTSNTTRTATVTDGGHIGGPCTYVTITGTATIVSVGPVLDPYELENHSCSNDPVEVRFIWEPDDPSDVNLGRYYYIRNGFVYPHGLFLLISGMHHNPPRQWVEQEDLTTGSRHACEVEVITAGACTPLAYTFTDVDYDAGIGLCQ